ncbi:MAG: CapA family protein [Microthrixaceae bacterium]|nr:CapA family protein [Microthrixaceae bacterium]
MRAGSRLARSAAVALLFGVAPLACATPVRTAVVDRGAPTATTAAEARGVSLVTAPTGPVTFAFGGDVHFEGELRTALAADPATVLADIAPSLSAADLAMVNLETAITDGGTPEDKEFTFRAPATAFDALRAAGVDVVSMANNHGRDYGAVGLTDSLAARDASGFPVLGIGHDATEAFAPYRTVVNGQRIAVLAATDVLDGHLIASWTATDEQPGLASAKDRERLVAAVAAARPTADTVVVFLHWGTEGQTCPNGTQPELARQLVDAGADIVVGSHAHRLIGGGRMGDALVAYGLGNFAFYTSGGPGADTGVLHVTATGRHIDDYRWEPAVISGGRPRPLTGGEAEAAAAAWADLRACTDLSP